MVIKPISKKIEMNPKIWVDSFNWKYEAYPFFTSVYTLSSTEKANKYESQWRHFVNQFKNKQLDAYVPKEELLGEGRLVISELLHGDETFLAIFKIYYQQVEDLIELCQTSWKNKNFVSIWSVIHCTLSNASKILFGFDYGLDEYFFKLQTDEPKLFEVLHANITEKKPSFLNLAQDNLIGLVDKYPKNFSAAYQDFVAKYGWIQNSYKGSFIITQDWLWQYYLKIKNYQKVKNQSKRKLPKRYQSLVNAASLAVSFRDDKKKLLLLVVEIMDRWLDDVCRQYKFHKQEMLWLTVDEVLKIIYEKENSFLLAAKKYAELGGRWGIMNPIGYNDIPQKLWLDVVKANKTKGGIKEFSGTIGNGGCVRGRAHIIFDAKNNNKFFNEGEILVTSMTRPEFLPLMSKALAFVTNEGGLTCHAAIVTREMNKPCVIGTKIATQVLKDGNLVEVDGDNGVVRILKK